MWGCSMGLAGLPGPKDSVSHGCLALTQGIPSEQAMGAKEERLASATCSVLRRC